MDKHWFKRKQYGWGWYPATWQGWTIIGIYLICMLLAVINARFSSANTTINLFSFLPEVTFYTIILLIVCYKNGESPKWEWGKNKE